MMCLASTKTKDVNWHWKCALVSHANKDTSIVVGKVQLHILQGPHDCTFFKRSLKITSNIGCIIFSLSSQVQDQNTPCCQECILTLFVITRPTIDISFWIQMNSQYVMVVDIVRKPYLLQMTLPTSSPTSLSTSSPTSHS